MGEPIEGSHSMDNGIKVIHIKASGHLHVHYCLEYVIASGASSDMLLISSETDRSNIVAIYREWESAEESVITRDEVEGIL